LEVGIDDWLHLVFEVDRNKYHLKDVIDGFVKFKKVSIRLVSMELQLIKKEILIAGNNSKAETEIISRFEIMDGAPIKNETIPIKWFIAPYELTPTYLNINNRLTVQYFINLVLIDVEERRYFKQHEVNLVRLDKKTQKLMNEKIENKHAEKRKDIEKVRDIEKI
jgi:vacuolar protein sorting-associated protein 26